MIELWILAFSAFFEAKDWLIDRLIRALCFCIPWRFRIVPDASTGKPMLRQFALIRGGSRLGKRYGALYLQHFDALEPLGFCHVHRWERMRSWVLSGAFIEERFALEGSASRLEAHIAGERYEMDRSVIHRVAFWSPRCWTLFHMSSEQSDNWGWFAIERNGPLARIAGALIPWRQHIIARVPSLDTKQITH